MSDETQRPPRSGRTRQKKQNLAPVSLTMAILAVLVATVSLLGHRAHTEEILMQTRATDQWAYYQAKNMRRNTSGGARPDADRDSQKTPPKADKVHQLFARRSRSIATSNRTFNLRRAGSGDGSRTRQPPR